MTHCAALRFLLVVAIFLAPALGALSGCKESAESLKKAVGTGTGIDPANSKTSTTEDLFEKAVEAYRRQDFKTADQA